MTEFVLNRGYNLISKGHNIKFVKGQPTYVPPELHREAAAIGAEAIGEKVDVLSPEDVPEVQLTTEDKQKLFYAAFDKLIARGDREDFGGDGKPSVPALKVILPFAFDKKERDMLFQAYREMKAAQADE